MIIDKNINVKISKKTIGYFKSKGYENLETNKYSNIKIEDLSKGSHIKINVKCDVCDKTKELSYQKYIKNINNGGYYSCSSKCSQLKVKSTNLNKFGSEYYSQTEKWNVDIRKTSIEKYGVEHFTQSENVKKKQEITNLKKYGIRNILCTGEKRDEIIKNWKIKYGVDNPSKSDIIKDKISNINKKKYKEYKNIVRDTCMKKYGVDNIFKSKEFQDKIKEKLINEYGVDNVFKSKEFQDKIKKTNLEKYGVINPMQNKEIRNKALETYNQNKVNFLNERFKKIDLSYLTIKNDYFYLRCDKGHTFKIHKNIFYNRKTHKTIICTKCNPVNKNVSGLEIELLHFIQKNYPKEIITNSRKIISPLELDIYLPDLNLAFEFNGLYWHSIEQIQDINYHRKKADLANENEIFLINIWEDDWLLNKEKVKQNILNILQNKIYKSNSNDEMLVESSTFEEYFLLKNGFKLKKIFKPTLCIKKGLNNKIYNIYDSGKSILMK